MCLCVCLCVFVCVSVSVCVYLLKRSKTCTLCGDLSHDLHDCISLHCHQQIFFIGRAVEPDYSSCVCVCVDTVYTSCLKKKTLRIMKS